MSPFAQGCHLTIQVTRGQAFVFLVAGERGKGLMQGCLSNKNQC